MTLALETQTTTAKPTTVQRLVQMNPQADFGTGWRLFSLKAKDAKTAAELKSWQNARGRWYGAFGVSAIRAEVQTALNKSFQGKGTIKLPDEKTLIPASVAKPVTGSNYCDRKWYNDKKQTFYFWGFVSKSTENAEIAPAAVLGIAVGVVVVAFVGFWVGNFLKNVETAVSRVEAVTQPLSAASSSVQQGVAAAAATIEPPKITQTFADNSGNPWLWVGLAGALLFGSIMLRQVRGFGRDLGSAVSSTNQQVRADLDDISDNPAAPSSNAPKRRRR
jgi:hypothetical protein